MLCWSHGVDLFLVVGVSQVYCWLVSTMIQLQCPAASKSYYLALDACPQGLKWRELAFLNNIRICPFTLLLSFLHLFPVPQEAHFENYLESFWEESSYYFHATARSGHATDAMFDLYYKSMLWKLVLAKERRVDCVVCSQRAPLIIEYDL